MCVCTIKKFYFQYYYSVIHVLLRHTKVLLTFSHCSLNASILFVCNYVKRLKNRHRVVKLQVYTILHFICINYYLRYGWIFSGLVPHH